MPPVELTSIENIADLVQMGFGKDLNTMHFLFCVKNKEKNYIFQEIHAVPIKRLVYSPSDYTITFCASWNSQERIESLILDADKEEIRVWQDLMDRSRPYNSPTNGIGTHSPDWSLIDRQSTYHYKHDSKKRKEMAKKFDTFIETRIEDVYAVNFYTWGFEIFSKSINLIAFTHFSLFPYVVDDHGVDVPHSRYYENRFEMGENGIPIRVPLKWTGWSLSIPNATPELATNMVSYWRRNDPSTTKDDFCDEIEEILSIGDKNKTPDIGQRKIQLDL